MKTSRLRRGFTLVEVALSVALIAILASMLTPSLAGLVDTTQEREARAKRDMLNLAKSSYLRENGQSGFSSWGSRPSDDDRFALLKVELGPGCQAATLQDFLPSHFTVSLTGLGQSVRLFKDGVEITY